MLPALKNAIRTIIQNGQKRNPNLSGDFQAGKSFFTTGKLQGGNWVLSPQPITSVTFTGSLLDDPTIAANLNSAKKLFNNSMIKAIQNEMNKKKDLFQGDTITHHESNSDGFSFDV
jgi:hypothetical protein